MNENIQALEAQLAPTTDPQQKIDLLNTLAREWRNIDPTRSLALAQTAYELASTGPDPYLKGKLDSLRQLSRANGRLGNYSLAFAQAQEALPLAEQLRDFSALARLLTTIGSAHEYMGRYAEALSYFLQALELAEAQNDPLNQIHALNSIGVLYNRTGDYPRSLETYHNALQIEKRIGRRESQSILLNNIAMTYYSMGDYLNALGNATDSLQIAHEIGSKTLEANDLCTIGDIYLKMGQHVAALNYFQQSMELCRQTGFRYVEVYALTSIGNTQVALNQARSALPYLQEALALTEALNTKPEQAKCHQSLAEAYKQVKDFEKALTHYEQFHALRETIFNEEADQRLKNLQILYQTEATRKEAEIYHLRNVELEQEIGRRKQVEAALQEHANELKVQNAELDAFAHTVAHDLKNIVNLLMGYTGLLQEEETGNLSQSQKESLGKIIWSSQKVKSVINSLLLLARTRKPEEIETYPIDMPRVVADAQSTLQLMIAEYQANIVVPTSWPIVWGYEPWIEEVWVNYLSNGIKYGGHPPHLELGCAEQDGFACFWVQDNGDGLTPAQQAMLFVPFERLNKISMQGHGLGLSIVKRIVEKLGGEVGVKSVVGQGSKFYFTLPLHYLPKVTKLKGEEVKG